MPAKATRKRASRASDSNAPLDPHLRGGDDPISNLRRVLPAPDFGTFWQKGWVEIPSRAQEYVFFAEFRADPEDNPLRTPSGRIEIYSDEIARFAYDDCPPHSAWIEPAEWLGSEETSAFPLHLVSSQPRHRLHSQMDAVLVSARGKIAGREALAINPVDAKSRGIGDGEVCAFSTRVGPALPAYP